MNFFKICIITLSFFTFKDISANEPFVILEYNKMPSSINAQTNRDNPFLRNSSYNTTHKVKVGDSLSGIINEYYSNTGLNKKIIEVSIIEINSTAFVNKNPHYLFAGKDLKIPSVNEIMQLVKNTPDNSSVNNLNKVNHIYFFGGN